MADQNNTIKTTVQIDASQAQQEIIKLNAVATDSTQDLQTRILAKNKAVEKQHQLSEQTIENLEEEIKLLEGLGASEKEIEKTQKKLNAAKTKQVRETANATKAQNKLNDSYKKSKNPLDQLDKGTGGLITKLNLLATNPIVAILGLIVGAFVLVKKAINSTEDGAAKFNAIIAGMSQIFENLITVISSALQPLLDWLIKVFQEDLSPALQAMSTYTDTLKLAFKALGDYIELLLTPIKAVITAFKSVMAFKEGGLEAFKESWKEFGEDVKETAVSLKDNFVAAVKEGVNATMGLGEAFEDAKTSADNLLNSAVNIELWQNRFNKAKREQQLLDAKLNTQAKEALAASKDTTKAWQDQQKALEKFIELQRERSANQKSILDEEIKLLEARRNLGGNTLEDEEAYNQLLIRREQLNAALADRERDYYNRNLMFINKRKMEEKAAQDAKDKLDADARAKAIELRQRDIDAQFEIDALDIERRRLKGEEVLTLQTELLERQRDNELENTELTELERQAILEKYAGLEVELRRSVADAKEASEKQFADSAIKSSAEAFGISKEVSLAQMLMAAPQAIGQSFKKAAETYPFPASLVAGAAGAVGTVAPIIKSITDIKKLKVKGAPPSSGASAAPATASASAPTTTVSNLSANNAARLGVDPSLSNAATQKASANVQGSNSGNVVFSESEYNDFQKQVEFKEDKATF